MRKNELVMILSSAMILAACGGGGAAGSNSDPPVINVPAPHDPGSTCGISPANGASSADGVEGEWAGSVPILGGIDSVFGIGLVTRDGAAQFFVGGQLIAGTVAATDTGRVNSSLASYTTGFEHAFVLRDTRAGSTTLQFDQVSRHDTLSGMLNGALSPCQPVDLHYQVEVIEQSPSLTSIAGVYSNSDDPDHSLVMTVDPDGRVTGSYWNGCTLLGLLRIPDATRNYFSASIDASYCGEGSGHYDGHVWLGPGASPVLYFGVLSDNRALFGALSRT